MKDTKKTQIDVIDEFIMLLNCNLDKINERKEKKKPTKEDAEIVKKKSVTNKNNKYILIIGFVVCIVAFLYFCQSLYISINIPTIENPFDGDTIDFYDFVEC